MFDRRLSAVEVSPEERALCSDFRSSPSLSPLLELLELSVLSVDVLLEPALVLEDDLGAWDMMLERMPLAVVVSPDFRAFSREFRAWDSGLESSVSLVVEVVDPVEVELVDEVPVEVELPDSSRL
jgi:hypothetical protein